MFFIIKGITHEIISSQIIEMLILETPHAIFCTCALLRELKIVSLLPQPEQGAHDGPQYLPD